MDADATRTVPNTGKTQLVQLTTDGVPKLHCPVCNKALGSLAGYVKHVKKHEPPGGFKCRYCNAAYCQEDQLGQHVQSEHSTLTCQHCTDASFSSAEEYRAHINQRHGGVERPLFVCDKCNTEYKSLRAYKDHIESECATQRPFKCEQCEATFVCKYNYDAHKRHVHEGEKHFRCSYCEKSFSSTSRLQTHERTHTGEKPYKCEICGKCFAHRESIVTHASVHTGKRLVQCKCCAERFSCYSNLIKHRRRRPDTCGLPKYNSPKTHKPNQNTHSMPADLDSKASPNRVTRPAERDKIKLQKAKIKEQPVDELLGLSEEQEEFISVSNNTSDSEDDMPLASRLKVAGLPTTLPTSSLMNLKQETITNDLSDSEEEYPDFEPANSEDEVDANEFKLPAPALVKEEVYDADFEYQDATLYMQSTCDVKEEGAVGTGDIFSNEKDKFLDALLSTDDDVPASTNGSSLKPFETLKVENATGILYEIADVPIDTSNEMVSIEEDVLALKDTTPVEEQLDELSSEDDTAPVKSPEETPKKRKSRKRTPSPLNKRSGVAKITKKELKERLKMLSKVEKTWKCPHCVKIYHIRKPYEKHLRDDHKLLEQDIKDIFKDGDAHAKLDEEVFKCKICSKIYLVEKRLETHMKVHGEDGSLTFKCPCYCNVFFASKEEATAHAHKQHKELLYCEKCDKYMTGHDSLKNHEKNFHTKKQPRNQPRNLICDKCGKKFSGRTSLSDHVRSDCGRLPLYQCSVCGKRLSTAGILKTHMLLHQSETPYQCDKCGKTFKVKAQYKSHLKTRHTDYKPYKCHLCPKEYPYRESLLTHMTVHTGIKRFLCNNCGKRFTCISNLQAHRKVHADTCGQLPLNAKATQYMGVQRGKLLMGAKPEAGMEYEETKTFVAQEVIDSDVQMTKAFSIPSAEPPMVTVPLNYASSHLVPHIVLQTMQAEAHEST